MTLQTERRFETESGRPPTSTRPRRRVAWALSLLLAMVAAALVGVAVAAQLTRSTPAVQVVSETPNANTREGRVPAPTFTEPNANTREGRVPTTS
jgi:hypothetical protein